MTVRAKKKAAAVAGIAAFSLVLAACGSDDGDGATATDDAAVGTGDASASGLSIDCAPYEAFGDLSGTQVSVYSPIREPEASEQMASYEPFEECTGVTVNYEGSAEFEAQIVVRVQSGNPPDIAIFPQPGLLQTVVRDTGAVVPAPDETVANVDEWFAEDWKAYGTVDDAFYAAPLGSNSKSFVWYNPSVFADAGYEVPETWEDMIALSDQIVTDGGKPWCAGIGSGDATGWPATDWMEDVMLRENGPEVYDQWVNHEIPFNDPQVAAVLERVGTILKNPDYVNAGIGDIPTIASTTFQDGGLPVLSGDRFMHRQASFYQAQWPEGTEVSADGDVFAFYFPGPRGLDGEATSGGRRVRGGLHRPSRGRGLPDLPGIAGLGERQGVGDPGSRIGQRDLGLDASLLESEIDQLAAEQFQDPGGNPALRRPGPDAGRGRCRIVLAGDDRVDRF